MSNAPRSRAAVWVAGALLVAGLVAIYVPSPRHGLFDSRFALLTSESLLRRASWNVEPLLADELAEDVRVSSVGARFQRHLWQLEPLPDGRIIYRYPPGTPLFSLPFVAVALPFGGTTLGADGRYSRDRETRLQIWLAALLAGLTAWVVQRMALRELPLGPATAVALVAGLGGPLWSTASRSLWPQTWAAVWVAFALLELLRWEDGERRRPELLAVLCSAAFWARPTAALFAAPIALFVALRHRAALLRLVATGSVALAGYGLLSKLIWSSWVPAYAQVLKRGVEPSPLRSLVLQLASIPQGFLVYSPIIVAIVLALAVYGVTRERRPFALLVVGIWVAHVALYALWKYHAEGAASQRFLTEVTPCFAWLGAHAWRRSREAAKDRPRSVARSLATRSAVVLFALASVAAHANGALDMQWPNLYATMRHEMEVAKQGGPPATTRPIPEGDELPQWRFVRWLATEWWPGSPAKRPG